MKRTLLLVVLAVLATAMLTACSRASTGTGGSTGSSSAGGSTGGSSAGGAGGGSGTAGSSSDPGETIFTTGVGHSGPIPRSSMSGPFASRGPACAMCHGAQGQGTGIGPNITRATLGSKHTITHLPSASNPAKQQPVTEGPWTTAQTVEVVRTGATPEGNHLGGRMPRWQLDAQDAAALAAYLGKL